MIVEYIRYRIPAGGGPGFEAAYGRAAEVLTGSLSCLDYELSRRVDEQTGPVASGTGGEPDDTERYVLRVRWTSSEDHLDGFRRSPEFRTFIAAIRPYLADTEEMRHYALTPVIGSASAARWVSRAGRGTAG